jgi:drug/metabolite transporter (DMT)-like permease
MGWPGRHLPLVALGGVLDTLANLLFTVASTLGPLGIVSILGSLYPVATVLLGRLVLSERLSRTQWGGVALALAGVVLVSAR